MAQVTKKQVNEMYVGLFEPLSLLPWYSCAPYRSGIFLLVQSCAASSRIVMLNKDLNFPVGAYL